MTARGYRRDPGGDAKANISEPAQLLHHGVYVPGISSLRIENGFCVIEDEEHFLGGQEPSKGGQVFRVFDTGANGCREVVEKIGPRGLKLFAADKPPVLVKSFLDATVVEDAQGNGCLADTTCTDESDWGEAFSKADDLLDQLIPSEKGSRRWWWWFPEYAGFKCKILGLRPQLKWQT